jgi:capsular polysaccharide biosynthesis protein
MEEMEPNAGAAPAEEISLIELLLVLADNSRLLVFGPLCVGIVALALSFFIKPTFTATTVFLPPQQNNSLSA